MVQVTLPQHATVHRRQLELPDPVIASHTHTCSPLMMRHYLQANTVLAKHSSDGPCISSLAALLSSCLAKLLHEAPGGSYAATHSHLGAHVNTANALCEVLLFPVIRSTFR